MHGSFTMPHRTHLRFSDGSADDTRDERPMTATETRRYLQCGFCGQPAEDHADSDAGPMTRCTDKVTW